MPYAIRCVVSGNVNSNLIVNKLNATDSYFIYLFLLKIEPPGMNEFSKISTEKSFGSHSEKFDIYKLFAVRIAIATANAIAVVILVFRLLKGNVAMFIIMDELVCETIYRFEIFVRAQVDAHQ